MSRTALNTPKPPVIDPIADELFRASDAPARYPILATIELTPRTFRDWSRKGLIARSRGQLRGKRITLPAVRFGNELMTSPEAMSWFLFHAVGPNGETEPAREGRNAPAEAALVTA